MKNKEKSASLSNCKANLTGMFILSLVLAVGVGVLGFGKSARAGVDLPWETTYDCADWTQSDWINDYIQPDCNDIRSGGDWICTGGEEEQITAAANNSDGGGGKGQRHWMGDGENVGSGGLRIPFNSPQSELWVRWYVRFENGFEWGPYLHSHKMLYFDVGGNDQFQPNFYGWDRFRIYAYGTEAQHRDISSAEGTGWDTIMVNGDDVVTSNGETHKLSDGQWHCYEIHVKQESSLGAIDGIAEMWVDGNLIIQTDIFQFGNDGVGWEHILVPSNQKYANNGRCMAVDIDDIKIVGFGDSSLKDDGNGNLFIGPLNATDTTPPTRSNSQPTGTLSSGTTQTTISLTTDETATCKYSETAGTDYDSMTNIFTNTNSTSHSTLVTGLEDGNSYTYHVRCQDESGNSNTDDFDITFSIEEAAVEIPDASSDPTVDDQVDSTDDIGGEDGADGDGGGGGGCGCRIVH